LFQSIIKLRISMFNRSDKRQQMVRAAILQGVYRDNLPPEKRRMVERNGRSQRWWRAGIGSLLVILPLAALFIHLVFLQGGESSSVAEIHNASYTPGKWQGGLPPLITEAKAGVSGGEEPHLAGRFWDGRPFSGNGVLAAADNDPADGGGHLPGAEDYGLLLNQPGMAMADLFGLEVHTIVIDAGHGGEDPGAIGPNGLMEKDITLKIARLLYNRLEDEEGLRVILTRDSDVTLSLKHRVEFVRENDADLLISIHLNTIPNDPMTIVETYYFGPPSDAQSLEVARKENRHSQYAVGDFSELIAQIGDTLKQQESRKLASHIQKSVYRTLRRGNHRLIDAGIKTAPFVVLLGTEIPSVLAEVTCISNTDEEARLAKPAYRDKIAAALERGILSYLSQSRRQQKGPPERRSITHAES